MQIDCYQNKKSLYFYFKTQRIKNQLLYNGNFNNKNIIHSINIKIINKNYFQYNKKMYF